MWYIYKIILLKLKRKFEDNFIGSLEISFPNNKIFRFGNNSKISSIKIKSNSFLFKLLFLGTPYIGHGYFKGDWVTENLEELLALGIKNKKLLNSIPIFNIFLFIVTKISKIHENNLKSASKQAHNGFKAPSKESQSSFFNMFEPVSKPSQNLLKTKTVSIPCKIKPVAPPTLTIVRRIKQTIHYTLKCSPRITICLQKK